jgi:hypothetical protein
VPQVLHLAVDARSLLAVVLRIWLLVKGLASVAIAIAIAIAGADAMVDESKITTLL